MREINNPTGNLNPTNLKKIDPKKDVILPAEQEPENSGLVNVTDNLSNSPEAIIGRSQIHSNLENDMKIMLSNPDAVEKAVKFAAIAEQVLEKQGAEAPYEKAAILANAFKDEFLS